MYVKTDSLGRSEIMDGSPENTSMSWKTRFQSDAAKAVQLATSNDPKGVAFLKRHTDMAERLKKTFHKDRRNLGAGDDMQLYLYIITPPFTSLFKNEPELVAYEKAFGFFANT